jgi:peptidyl-prolyl cis-trans isomerase SurA
MLKRKFSVLVVLLVLTGIVSVFSGCSSTKKMVVAEIGNEKISLYDFEKQYLKTVGNIDTARNKSENEKKEFLDLLIKFRLKVKDGKDRGFTEIPEIKNEISDFKKKYIPEFYIDKEVVEPAIKLSYERRKYDLRTSYILINMPGQPSPEDSVKAYLKADSAIKALKDGKDFMEVAKQYTEDQGFANNKGDTYYITAGMVPIEFEDAIYDLKVGEYTKTPIKINNAIFIAKLTDKKKRSAGIRLSHIMLQDKKDSLNRVIDTLDAFNRIKDLKSKISKDNFAELAQNSSEDPGSKTKGGDIGMIDNRRRLPQEIDSLVFSLKVGQVSEPVKSQFGWHLFLVTEEKEFESYEKQREALRSEYKKGMSFKPARTKFVEKIFAEYDFKADPQGIAFLQSKFDSTKTFSQMNLDSIFAQQDKQILLATFKGGEVKVEDLISYLNINKDWAGNTPTNTTIKNVIQGSAEMPILNISAIKANIEKDDEFTELLTEYENGLISFRIDQDELFSKIKITNDEMQTYYNGNSQSYNVTDSTGTHTKPFEDVKAEISNKLQQDRFKEMENKYIQDLKAKYPVKIDDKILEKAFKTK